jgi:hypothetical protein
MHRHCLCLQPHILHNFTRPSAHVLKLLPSHSIVVLRRIQPHTASRCAIGLQRPNH